MLQRLTPGAKSILLVCCVLIYHSTALYAQNKVGIGTTLPESLLHVKNDNTNANASQLIIEANSGFGGSTTSALEFRSNFTSGGVGPSGRIRSYYTSNNYTDARTTFQTIGPGPAFVDAMTLTNGRIGIGTTAPENLMHIKNANTNADGSQLIIEGNSGAGNSTTSAIEFRSNFTGGSTGLSGRIRSYYTSNNATDAKTTFQTIGPGPALVDAMTLTNGRVGIGTATPENLLHLKNANTNGSQLIIEANSGFGGSTTSAIEFRSNFASGGAGPSGRIRSYYTSNNYTDARTTFQTVGPGPAFVDAMTLTNGRIGIGTTSPTTAKLVIATNPGETGIDLSSSDAYAEMRIIRNTLGTADKNLYLGFNALPGSAINLYSEGLTPTMTIKGNNVGIGTQTPVQKLDVNGNVNISGSIINEAWQIPALLNNWVNYGSGLATAAYYKDKEGRVHLKGSIKNGTSVNLFLLPAGYRPSEQLWFIVYNDLVGQLLRILPNGTVFLPPGFSNVILSLDGVSFRAEQ